jgi:hypothetical protein
VQGFARGRLADRRQDALADLLIKLAALGLLRFRRCCHLVVCELDADYRAEGFAQAVQPAVDEGDPVRRGDLPDGIRHLQTAAELAIRDGLADPPRPAPAPTSSGPWWVGVVPTSTTTATGRSTWR